MTFTLLHTADLHLGQRFHDQGRGDDESDALEQILAIVRAREIDLVCLAGDIFDIANPGVAEVQRYHEFLERLVLDEGVGTVVAIAGNHDNHARIAGPSRLFERCNIHARGVLRQGDSPGSVQAPILDRAGARVGTALAIPFLREADIRTRGPGESPTEAAAAFRQAMTERLGELHAACTSEWPTVVLAHAFAAGGAEGGGERPVQVGNLGAVPAAALAGSASYLALGHLHRPQSVGGQEHWRYSGSLLPSGFDETGWQREVVIATVTDTGPARVERIPLRPWRDYRLLDGNETELLAQVDRLPEPVDGAAQPWLRARVHLSRPAAGFGQHLADRAAGRGWQFLGVDAVHVVPAGQSNPGAATVSDAASALAALDDPAALFARHLENTGIDDSDGALRQSFASIVERCEDLLADEGS